MKPRRNARPRTEHGRQDRERALATLARMRREGLTLETAAKAEQIDPNIVLRYAGSALQSKGRTYFATEYDRIPRTLYALTPQGTVPVTVHDSRTASQIAEHMNAVRTYLRSGNSSALAPFKGKMFVAGGTVHFFVTNLPTLDRLADAGMLAVETLYYAPHGAL